MKRILVAAFAEVPSLSFESEAATELAKTFEGRHEVDVLAPMAEAAAHLEAFHGGRLHRSPLPSAGDLDGTVTAFRRALERQLESAAYDAVHLFSPVEGRTVVERLAPEAVLVYEPQPIPAYLYRLPPPSPEWQDLRAADDAALVDRATLLLLHDAGDAGALRYRRHLPPHLVLPEPVDLDAYHWEQLVPSTAPVVLVLDPGLDEATGTAIRTALAALPGAAVRWLHLTTARLEPSAGEEPIPLTAWFSGPSAGGLPVRLRIAARTVLNSADVVVVPHAARYESPSVATSARRWGILEAAACRRPLVVCDAPGFPLPSALAEHLFRFPAGDWDAMAQTVRSVLFHPAKAAQVAERARQRIESTFAASAYRRRLAAIYAGLLGPEDDRPGPASVRPGLPPE